MNAAQDERPISSFGQTWIRARAREAGSPYVGCILWGAVVGMTALGLLVGLPASV